VNMPAQVLDYSLTNFKVPGLAQYTPPFGTKKADGSGLTTTEITRNEMMPFMKQRPISGVPAIAGNDPPMGVISVDSIAMPIEFDANFAVMDGIQLQLDDPSYEGQVVRVVASFDVGNPTIITLGVAGTPQTVALNGGETMLLFAVNNKWVRFKNGLETAGASKTPRERYLFYNTPTTLRLAGGVPIRYKDSYTNDYRVYVASDEGLIIDVAATLDTGSIQAGKPYFVYLCPQQTGGIVFKTSLNASYPLGVASADYAFQIGGFDTICVNVGTISTTMYIHPFSGRLAGNIHMHSVWDLYHRSSAKYQSGFYFSPSIKKWVSIYLMGATGTFPATPGGDSYPPVNGGLVSGYGLTIADGASTPKWHGDKFAQFLKMQGMLLPLFDEFTVIALGSPESVNIQGSVDPVTTGGHTATNGQRIISFEGAEDATGVLWQWCQETLGPQGTQTWVDRFDANDIQAAGQMYGAFYRLLAGGDWINGATCGSRASSWADSVLSLSGHYGCRAVAEPLN
jgi:hypothetical protein